MALQSYNQFMYDWPLCKDVDIFVHILDVDIFMDISPDPLGSSGRVVLSCSPFEETRVRVTLGL